MGEVFIRKGRSVKNLFCLCHNSAIAAFQLFLLVLLLLYGTPAPSIQYTFENKGFEKISVTLSVSDSTAENCYINYSITSSCTK